MIDIKLDKKNYITILIIILLLVNDFILFTNSSRLEKRITDKKTYREIYNIKYSVPNYDYLNRNKDNLTIVWIFSDPHFVNDYSRTVSPVEWNDIIYDAINLQTDYAFCLGDVTNWENPMQNPLYWNRSWNIFYNNPGYLFNWNNLQNYVMGRHLIVGNHDANYMSYHLEEYNHFKEYFVGNVLFIGLNDESVPGYGYPHDMGVHGDYRKSIDLVNQSIQRYNDVFNVFILCHYPMEGTVGDNIFIDFGEEAYGYTTLECENQSGYQGILEYASVNGFSVCGWFSGHAGVVPERGNFISRYGTIHVNALHLALGGSPIFQSHNSIFLIFEEGVFDVLVLAFNHDNNCWIETDYFPSVLKLRFPFENK